MPSRDLEQLHRWAVECATDDPDPAARRLWAQIAREVAAYLQANPPPDPADADLWSLAGF